MVTNRVAQGLEEKLVSHHVHSKLLITEGVEAGSASAGGCADLQPNRSSRMRLQHNMIRRHPTGSGSTLYAIVRMASARLETSWRSLGSEVASASTSERVSPSCAHLPQCCKQFLFMEVWRIPKGMGSTQVYPLSLLSSSATLASYLCLSHDCQPPGLHTRSAGSLGGLAGRDPSPSKSGIGHRHHASGQHTAGSL